MILNYLRPCKPQVEVQSKICLEKFVGRIFPSHLRFLYLEKHLTYEIDSPLSGLAQLSAKSKIGRLMSLLQHNNLRILISGFTEYFLRILFLLKDLLLKN